MEKQIHQFLKLRTAKNKKVWSALTCHRAPHKPFLLLSILDLIAQRKIKTNSIEPSYDLVDTFNIYWRTIMPLGSRGLMSYPFYHMRSEPFWNLIPNQEYKDRSGLTISSMIKLRERYAAAKIDENLFELIKKAATREQLRAVLIQSYFDPEIQPTIVEQGAVNYGAYKYSKKVLQIKESIKPYGEESEKDKKVRDQGFRTAIVDLYDHRCALCGIRMLTPEGHTIVEAAHIIPWRESQNDHVTNGMSLCRLCHWSFDEGLMGVGHDYEVLISNSVKIERNILGHILPLQDRPIFRPQKEIYWPAQENLNWHREKSFIQTR